MSVCVVTTTNNEPIATIPTVTRAKYAPLSSSATCHISVVRRKNAEKSSRNGSVLTTTSARWSSCRRSWRKPHRTIGTGP
jgi:hypothetical protein